MMHKLISFCLAALVFLVPPVAADPLADAIKVRILPGWRAADGAHIAGVDVNLAQGWKTYWRAPGDAGIPPQFDWRGSQNLLGVEITWPTPEAMQQNGMQAIGYSDRLILPLRVVPKHQGRVVKLSGQLEIGVCKDVCIPVTINLSQTLPPDVTKPDPQIAAAIADRPYSAKEAGVGRVVCHITPKAEGLRLRAEVDMPSAGGREIAVVETDNPQVWVAQAKTHREGGRLIAETEMYHNEGRAFALNRSGVRITVLGKSHAVDIQGCPTG